MCILWGETKKMLFICAWLDLAFFIETLFDFMTGHRPRNMEELENCSEDERENFLVYNLKDIFKYEMEGPFWIKLLQTFPMMELIALHFYTEEKYSMS